MPRADAMRLTEVEMSAALTKSISPPTKPATGTDTAPAGGGSGPDPLRELAELKRQVFDLHAVFEVARRFHEVWDVDALIDGILHVAIEHMRVAGAAIATGEIDSERQFSKRKSKGWDLALGTVGVISCDNGLARCLEEYRRPLPLDALRARVPGSGVVIDPLRDAGCVLVAPMVRHDRLRGILLLAEKVDRSPYSGGDLEFLDLLMDQFTVSLDNALLYEREQYMNDQLLHTRQRLASAEKLAALGQMAASIAHEVRNPIGIIRNYLALVRPSVSTMPEEARRLQIIDEEIERIELFVQNLLGAFHPERALPGAVDVRAMADDVARFLGPRFVKRNVTAVNRVGDEVPRAFASPDALRQVLINLLLNAIDATPAGGTVTVGASVDSAHVHLSVSDTGWGIQPELLDRLFDPFVTTKPQGEGSGMGLSISKSLLERFDAQIDAHNQAPPASGAVFTIHLRRADVANGGKET